MPPQKVSADQTILFLQRAFSQIKSPLKKTVMAAPPTITRQAAFVQPQYWVVPLLNAVLVKVLPVNPGPFDTRFHISAPEMLSVRSTGGYNDGSIYNMLSSISPSNYGGSGLTVIRWCTDAPHFGLSFRWSPTFMLTVDGEYVSAAPISHPVAGASTSYVSLSHPTRKAREYCLMLGAGLDFGGIAVGANDTVWAPSIPDLRIVADGDSYLQSASSSVSSGIFSETAMAMASLCSETPRAAL